MRIAITGASGLLGSALARSLEGDGHEVVRLVRREVERAGEVRWDPERGYVDTAGLTGCDAFVHLAAKSITMRRWTPAVKQAHWDSRVHGTAAVSEALASMDRPPRVFLCGSAVGYYGDTGDRRTDETAPPGEGFLADMVQAWEAAAAPAQEAGVRTVFARTGLVVARGGGAWGKLFPIFRAGLGGRIGNGRQYWSFVALHDHVAAMRHLIDTDWVSGPVNVTAPEPVTNREVTAAMGRVLHRPTVLAVPGPVLKLVVGDFANDMLGSQRVVPARLRESGFKFAFPTVEQAVRAVA
ncbi:Epimerase family protein [Streptomyces sp. RB5]|uniref:Epimerase family protein n=2 Tax=Streptomyces smaragdinus TaxID=2585196 RepID=A0A7K0CCE9_9ACTN|nr:Epimerase family protein [Streptomyces smaragdinus]